MQFLQAKTAFNKLRTLDNSPYTIDRIEIGERGILLYLTTPIGLHIDVCYRDVEDIKREFYIVDSFRDLKGFETFVANENNYDD